MPDIEVVREALRHNQASEVEERVGPGGSTYGQGNGREEVSAPQGEVSSTDDADASQPVASTFGTLAHAADTP